MARRADRKDFCVSILISFVYKPVLHYTHFCCYFKFNFCSASTLISSEVRGFIILYPGSYHDHGGILVTIPVDYMMVLTYVNSYLMQNTIAIQRMSNTRQSTNFVNIEHSSLKPNAYA